MQGSDANAKPKESPKEAVEKPAVKGDTLERQVVSIDELNTDEERFQPRKGDFSEKTASSIENNFDEARMDDIRVWHDPKDGKVCTWWA